VYDRETGKTETVWESEETSWQFFPTLSTDGRWVAFVRESKDPVAGDGRPCRDDINVAYAHSSCSNVFLRDLLGKVTYLVSVSSAEETGDWGVTDESPALTADGRFVFFGSAASNLVDDDSNGVIDVFSRDVMRGMTSRESLPGGDSTAQSP
jgi:Tol biopolymer transport system component